MTDQEINRPIDTSTDRTYRGRSIGGCQFRGEHPRNRANPNRKGSDIKKDRDDQESGDVVDVADDKQNAKETCARIGNQQKWTSTHTVNKDHGQDGSNEVDDGGENGHIFGKRLIKGQSEDRGRVVHDCVDPNELLKGM